MTSGPSGLFAPNLDSGGNVTFSSGSSGGSGASTTNVGRSANAMMHASFGSMSRMDAVESALLRSSVGQYGHYGKPSRGRGGRSKSREPPSGRSGYSSPEHRSRGASNRAIYRE
eukprot:g1420.t1